MDARQRDGERYVGGTNKYIRDMSFATPQPDGSGCRPPGTHKLRDWRKDARQWMRFKRCKTIKHKEEFSGMETSQDSSPSAPGSISPNQLELSSCVFGLYARAAHRKSTSPPPPFVTTPRGGPSIMFPSTDLPTPRVAPVGISKFSRTAKYEFPQHSPLTFGYGKAPPTWAKRIPPPIGLKGSIHPGRQLPPTPNSSQKFSICCRCPNCECCKLPNQKCAFCVSSCACNFRTRIFFDSEQRF